MKLVNLLLVSLLIMLQFQLWAGDASFGRQAALKASIAKQLEQNQQSQQKNKILYAEIQDLRHGTEAIEERARHELGMIKPGEVFYRVVSD
jgi:cell division protein FtsB